MKEYFVHRVVIVFLLIITAFFNGCETQITSNVSDNPYMSYHEIRMEDNTMLGYYLLKPENLREDHSYPALLAFPRENRAAHRYCGLSRSTGSSSPFSATGW